MDKALINLYTRILKEGWYPEVYRGSNLTDVVIIRLSQSREGGPDWTLYYLLSPSGVVETDKLWNILLTDKGQKAQ
jgi:hypothetical protein